MNNLIISKFEKQHYPQTKQHPSFRPGDTVCVHYRLEEGAKAEDGSKKYRIQQFEGVCLRFRKGEGASSTFTIRKIGANGVGVERIFPANSSLIEKIDLISAGVVRRSRLYYLRDLLGKAARIRRRRLPEGALTSTANL
ncbi:50S ribosomal protein L19 [Candidatus Woesebacteria bacterium]|nr:50S ribosomal protein L19 [Candidatus Woesebacteria bacterium]